MPDATPNYSRANAEANEALQLWTAGRLEEAAQRYTSAIAMVPDYPDWHCCYAGVLNQLGRHAEATVQYEASLSLELAISATESTPSVKVARYFLANHLTQQGQPSEAIEVLKPALAAYPDDCIIGSAQSLALFAVGRNAEAKHEAERVISIAGTDEKRRELEHHLRDVLRSQEP
jgi:Flp pilus assembly protein TadD